MPPCTVNLDDIPCDDMAMLRGECLCGRKLADCALRELPTPRIEHRNPAARLDALDSAA
jgi:hypothetical protein